MTFKDRVREEMKFQGITAKELAAKAGISVNTLNMYIGYREAMPSAEIGLKIANALSVPLDYLVNGKSRTGKDMWMDEKSQRCMLQRQIMSLLNTMTEKQLENFVKVTKLFNETAEK